MDSPPLSVIHLYLHTRQPPWIFPSVFLSHLHLSNMAPAWNSGSDGHRPPASYVARTIRNRPFSPQRPMGTIDRFQESPPTNASSFPPQRQAFPIPMRAPQPQYPTYQTSIPLQSCDSTPHCSSRQGRQHARFPGSDIRSHLNPPPGLIQDPSSQDLPHPMKYPHQPQGSDIVHRAQHYATADQSDETNSYLNNLQRFPKARGKSDTVYTQYG